MSEVTSSILDLHDSEIIRIEGVVAALRQKQFKTVNLEDFRVEAIQRFEDVGFKVDVKTFSTDVDGVFAFDIDLVERLEGRFDPDQQVHEVTNDLLGLGEGGVIKTSAADMKKLEGHSHGNGHHHHH